MNKVRISTERKYFKSIKQKSQSQRIQLVNWKIQRKSSTADYIKQKKGSVNPKTGQWNSFDEKQKDKNEKEWSWLKSLLGHKVDQYTYYRSPRRKRESKKRAENLFREIWLEISITWGKKQTSRFRKLRVSNKMNPKRPSRPIIIKLSEVKRQGENLKSSKRKTTQ